MKTKPKVSIKSQRKFERQLVEEVFQDAIETIADDVVKSELYPQSEFQFAQNRVIFNLGRKFRNEVETNYD